MTDDVQTSRDERWFRLWIKSLGICTYVNNVFEDVRDGWVLLEVLKKISPGSVNWKHASRPPIKMSFRKVENCNQVIRIGKQLKISLVNVGGNDIVQGNKKLIIGMSSYAVFLFLISGFKASSHRQLCSLRSKFLSIKNQSGKVTVGDLPPVMVKLKAFTTMFTEEQDAAYAQQGINERKHDKILRARAHWRSQDFKFRGVNS